MDKHSINSTSDSRQLFESLFKLHFKNLVFFATRFVKDHDSAREIVHDVFINLWDKRDTIDPQKEIKSYLYTSVRNRSLNHLRNNKKFNTELLDFEQSIGMSNDSPDKALEIKELNRQIASAMDQLPEKCRQVFELSRNQNMKYAEISAELGISVKTVEAHMSKALQLLRRNLADRLVILLFIVYSVITLFLTNY